MPKILSFCTVFNAIQSKSSQTLTPFSCFYKFRYFTSTPSSDSTQKVAQTNVAIFWDLSNKPPKSIPLFDAAIGIKKAAETFGYVKYMAAFANRNLLTSVPGSKMSNTLENVSSVKSEPSFCGVCGRRFYNSEKLVNHFRQVHETEQKKRMNQIMSARGSRRVNLVGKFSMKMKKYKYAAKEVLNPKVECTLSDELKRAGFGVKAVLDKPEMKGNVFCDQMLNVVDMRQVGCVVIVSDDSDFVGFLNEARMKSLRTVVFGDSQNGDLKRVADAAFSWQEIILGKAKKEAVSVVGRWKDRDVLKSLEWTFDPDKEKSL